MFKKSQPVDCHTKGDLIPGFPGPDRQCTFERMDGFQIPPDCDQVCSFPVPFFRIPLVPFTFFPAISNLCHSNPSPGTFPVEASGSGDITIVHGCEKRYAETYFCRQGDHFLRCHDEDRVRVD